MNFRGWALFMDSDMIFLSDIEKLFAMADPKYAVQVVKHTHRVAPGTLKMDKRENINYHRKNWSSFILWNCAHPANRFLTEQQINFMKGGDLHAFSWLPDALIGELPHRYNYISGVSPRMSADSGGMPAVIHYTEGGPWFDECREVPYAGQWLEEYEDFQRHGRCVSHVPTTAHDGLEVRRK